MRSFAALAVLVALALAEDARADRADPLASRTTDWVSELVLLCAGPSAAELRWCTHPDDGTAPPVAAPPPPPSPPPPPPGKVAIASKEAHDPSSLTATAVAAKVQSAYAGGVLRCYRDALARRPGLRGALKVSFTVNAVGKIDDLTVKGMDEIATCVYKQAAGWRFPIPLSTYKEPRNARFTIGLALAP
jgi:hypothetical protein